jgi:phosphocarrier protein HPr
MLISYDQSENEEASVPKAEVEIINKLGLHARASAKLTQLAGSFPCEVWMERNGRRINAKSIMGVMMLAAGKGSKIMLDCEGERADEALQALRQLIVDRFGEDE